MNIAVNTVRFDDYCDVAVIGAGPYGLAAAAHLSAADVSIRVFGEAMSFWRRNMPEGMKLRSPWIATHIADPLNRYRLDDYFREVRLRRPDLVPVEDFIDYGTWFQERAVPDLDARTVVRVAALDEGFRLSLDDGKHLFARRVVMATGLLNHEHRPPQFDGLPRVLVGHSCEHTESSHFRGRDVAVIGSGQSACESAALLHEAGANVEIICRETLLWNADPTSRGTLRRMARSFLGDALIPPSQVGPFPFNWLVEMPGFIYHFSEHARERLNKHCLRATAALWLRSRLREVPVNEGCRILDARRVGERIALTLNNGTRSVDHVLLATGYRIDLAKIDILDLGLRGRIARRSGLPILSADFESNVPGLHFIGSFAVGSFGPLLRFIAGAGFAARRIARSAIAGGRMSSASGNNRFDVLRREARFQAAAERERS
jgi:FAD-dependent urate hydroxylase